MKKMMRNQTFGILTCSLLMTQSIFAHGKGHGPHEHGVAHLHFAIKDKTSTILFESPADSIYGFEYEPKTAADRAKQKVALDILKNKMGDFIKLDAALGCKFSNSKLEIAKEDEDHDEDHDKNEHHEEGEHREVHGVWELNCQKSLNGSKVHFAFSKQFPRLQRIQVEALSDMNQPSAEIKNDVGEIIL